MVVLKSLSQYFQKRGRETSELLREQKEEGSTTTLEWRLNRYLWNPLDKIVKDQL
jgi:hypothetical protein